MGLIYLALYKGEGDWTDRLIRWWTGSPYSHCELIMPDGRWLTSSGRDGGVRAKRIELDLEHWHLLPLPWANANQIEAFFQRTKGLQYDWTGLLLSQLLATAMHSDQRWFCSEFCAAALGFAMPQRFSPALLGEVVRAINTINQTNIPGQRNEAHA